MSDKKVRVNVSIETEQYELLKSISESSGVSVSSLVRRILDKSKLDLVRFEKAMRKQKL